MKMKRSQFKALIKECLTEILQEDVLMNRALKGAMYEGMLQQPMMPQAPQLPAFINPMDDQGLMLRQQQLMQQQALQRQSQRGNRQQQLMPPGGMGAYDYAAVAGLDGGDDDNDVRLNRNPDARTPGTRNPLDYLSLAIDRPKTPDPRLDTPVGGGQSRQRFIPSQGQHPSQHLHRQPQRQQEAPRRVQTEDVGSLSPEVLREMYADTYQTTFAEQAAEGHVRPGHMAGGQGGMSVGGAGDRFDVAVSRSDPSELFGGSAGNWESLAFGGK